MRPKSGSGIDVRSRVRYQLGMGRAQQAYTDRIALVTGAASGMGAELCRQLVCHGARVVATDIDETGLTRLAGELGPAVRTCKLDVRDAGSVADVVESVYSVEGTLDFVFNNAGIAVGGELHECRADSLERIIAINLTGATLVMHACLRRMVASGKGHIVNIASMWGLAPAVVQSAYAATKHGLVGMSLSVAPEAADLGVRLTAVCPGYIRTGLFAAAELGGMDPSEAVERIPFRLMAVEEAVRHVLDGVARGKLLVIFPYYVRIIWWIQRLSPKLMFWIGRAMVRRLRKRARGPR